MCYNNNSNSTIVYQYYTNTISAVYYILLHLSRAIIRYYNIANVDSRTIPYGTYRGAPHNNLCGKGVKNKNKKFLK